LSDHQKLKRPVKKAVFPVAGLGTRFLPATKVLPKEMLPLVDRPLIQRAVEEARDAGIEEFIFIMGRGKSLITEHFDVQPELIQALEAASKDALLDKVHKSDIETGDLLTTTQQVPMGLGHAVWCARKLVGDEPFALFLPDVMILSEDISHGGCMTQMMEAYDAQGGNVIATAPVPHELTYKYGIVDVKGNADKHAAISAMVEKPKPEDAPSNLHIVGRYILQPEIFQLLENGETGAGGEIQLTDAMVALLGQQNFTSVRFDGKHYDCGHHTGFIEANIAFALADPQFADDMKAILKNYTT
jgi:UTP--glucose-1-phosphate uridylyltransferase